MKFPRLACTLGALSLLTSLSVAAEEDFYVGTYTHWYGSKGIYHYRFDDVNGTVSGGELATKVSDPSYLIIHPNGRWLYTVNERKTGVVNAYGIARDGQLQLLSRQSSHGAWPCFVSFDGGHRHVFVANYLVGTVAVLPVQGNGAVAPASGFSQQQGTGPNHDRQEGPHAHSIYIDPANRFVYSCDLGNDHVEGYRYNAAKGTITPDAKATGSVPPGAGPRHLVIHPRGFVYVINEMGCSVTAFRRDEGTGALHAFQTVSTLPKGVTPTDKDTAAEIALHPNGKFLYASNRGHDNIAVFALTNEGGMIPIDHTATGGKTPRYFTFDPSGRWLLAENQDSNDIFVFKANPRTGKLTPNGQKVQVGAPVCIAFLPQR